MKKRIIAFGLCIAMSLSMIACTSKTVEKEIEEEMKLLISGLTADQMDESSDGSAGNSDKNSGWEDELDIPEYENSSNIVINKEPLPSSVGHWYEQALCDVFASTVKNEKSISAAEINMAKNESESIQVAIQSKDIDLSDVTVTVEKIDTKNSPRIKAMHIERIYNSKSSDSVLGGINGSSKANYIRGKSPNYFPEYYEYGTVAKKIAKGISESFLVEATSTASTVPGTYNTNLVINSAQGQRKIPITVTVFDVTIPAPAQSTLAYTNWSNTFADKNCIAPSQNSTIFDMMDGYYDFMNEDNMWKTFENYAKVMKKQRQNTILVPIYALLIKGIKINGDGSYVLDFTYFDKYINTFMKYGSIKYLEGSHAYSDDWYTSHAPTEPNTWPTGDLVSPVYVKKDGKITQEWMLVEEQKDRVSMHIDSLFSQLFAHLKANGWDNMWIQHVIDEPKSEIQTKQATALYKKLKEMCPSIELVDAGSDQNRHYKNEITMPCPQLDSYDRNKKDFDNKNESKYYKELWTYTCVGPQGNWMSRIGDYPLLSTRVLGWYCWQNKLDGYLHWAWNFWKQSPNGNPYNDMYCPSAPTDGWLVYPDGVHHSVKEGPRSTAVRDGFEDYEIIRLAAANNEQKTNEIMNGTIINAMSFERNETVFQDRRLQFLKIAAGQ